MSQTSAVTHRNIRRLIDDLNPESYAISSLRMANIVTSNVQILSGRVFQPMVAPETVALSAGTYDYALTLATQAVRQAILDSNGYELERMSFEELNSYYLQETDAGTTRAQPVAYALYEINSQVVRMRVAPTPDQSYTLNLYRDVLPPATAGDTTDVPFASGLLKALEKLCASECALVMTPEERALRMISPEVVARWERDAQQAIVNENWRQRFTGRSQRHVRSGGSPSWPR